MSRRRSSYTPAAPLTDEEVLAHFFGERLRVGHTSVPGCSASCCSSGLWDAVEEAEGRLRHALLRWTVVSVGITSVVAALVWLAWRWM